MACRIVHAVPPPLFLRPPPSAATKPTDRTVRLCWLVLFCPLGSIRRRRIRLEARVASRGMMGLWHAHLYTFALPSPYLRRFMFGFHGEIRG